MKQKLVLIASVIIGLFAALLTRSYLNAKDRDYDKLREEFNKAHAKIPVCVTKRALPSGTVLTAADIGVSDVIEKQVKGRVIKEANAVVLFGRKLTHAMDDGQLIGWQDIEGGDPLSRGLSGDLRHRWRAISINVAGAAAVSGMVNPNDHVDVLGTFSFPSKTVPGEMELVTFTVLQNVLILATGKETAKSRVLGERSANGNYNTVTLEVTPREAEMLVFTEQIKGRISLALRNPEDVYYETTLPRVNFEKIQATIEQLNEIRQQTITSPRRTIK
jgi:Flp pilus assembly protein CpaB